MSDIVERLRDYADPSKTTDCRDTDDMCVQAADEIERFRSQLSAAEAEVDRLRATESQEMHDMRDRLCAAERENEQLLEKIEQLEARLALTEDERDECRRLLGEAVYQAKPSELTTEFIAVLSKQWIEAAKAAGGGE